MQFISEHRNNSAQRSNLVMQFISELRYNRVQPSTMLLSLFFLFFLVSCSCFGQKEMRWDFVVPDDGGFREALKAANTRKDTLKRFCIFVRKGFYAIPCEGTTVGGDSCVYADPRCWLKAPNTSIIGEDRDSTILTNITPPATWNNGFGPSCPLEGIGKGDVLIIEKQATGTYIQDITLKSGMNDANGRNIVLHDRSDLTICNNVCLWGYQDTYVSNNAHGRFYFLGCIIRGRTDYICGKGDVFFDRVTFQQCAKGGYIAVPSVPRRYGFVMSNCRIVKETPDVTCYLGRPWGKGTPTASWINTVCEVPILSLKKNPAVDGWADMSSGWPARFAEYNTVDSDGVPLDLSRRRRLFVDKEGNEHQNNPVLTREEAEGYTLDKVFEDWNPSAVLKLLEQK